MVENTQEIQWLIILPQKNQMPKYQIISDHCKYYGRT